MKRELTKLSDLPFPEPPEEARDRELWTLLAQFEYVRWMREDRPQEYADLVTKLTGDSYLDRVVEALDEPEPLFRWRAAYFAIAYWREKRIDLILRILADDHAYVREHAASHLISIAHPEIETRMIEMALSEASADIRCAACRGLAGQRPLFVIPVLLRLLESDHQSGEHGWPVSHCAGEALDELMGTELMSMSREDVRANPTGMPDLQRVREKAIDYLASLRVG